MSSSDVEVFHIQTAWSTILKVDLKSGAIIHAPPSRDDEPFGAVYAYAPSHHPAACFLICTEAAASPAGSTPSARSASMSVVRLRRSKAGQTVQLVDPQNGLFYSARQITEGERTGAFVPVRDVAEPWEQFSLLKADIVPPTVHGLIEVLSPFLGYGSIANGLVQGLASKPPLAASHAITQLLSEEDIAAAALELLLNPRSVESLRTSQPEDAWATTALPDLLRWRSDRARPDRPTMIGPELDGIVQDASQAFPASLPAAFVRAIRRSTSPRKRLCALASARNEGPYVLDWLGHHMAHGVEDFFIYTNDNDDGSDDLLDILHRHGVIHLISNKSGPSIGPQIKAYSHALQFLPDILDYEWAAVIDLDEYIMFNENEFDSIQDYMVWASALDPDSVALSWTMHGSNGAAKWQDAPLPLRFPVREAPERHVKSIFKPRRFTQSHCHFPIDDPLRPRRYRTASGQPFKAWPWNEEPDCEKAWIAHFYYKSAEEFLVRRMRNRGDRAVIAQHDEELISPALANLFVSRFFQRDGGEVGVSAGSVSRATDQTDALRRLPGVAEADAICKAMYREEAERARALLASSARFNITGTPEAQLFEIAFGAR